MPPEISTPEAFFIHFFCCHVGPFRWDYCCFLKNIDEYVMSFINHFLKINNDTMSELINGSQFHKEVLAKIIATIRNFKGC